MPQDTETFYVLKSGSKYCRFSSYSTVTFVDTPFQATSYQREKDARKRSNQDHCTNAQVPEWIGPGEFSIMEITIMQWVEDDIS